MSFDTETVLLAALLIVVPAVFSVFTVVRHVSGFMRDVDAEEQAAKDSLKNKENLQTNRKQ